MNQPATNTAATTKPSPEFLTDDDARLLDAVRDRFHEVVGNGLTPQLRPLPLFTTDAADLWPLFLSKIPVDQVQTYTCHACRQFVERYGGLVAIEEDGETVPAFWGTGPGHFGLAVELLRAAVGRARVTGVFLSPEKVWGAPTTGPWHHFAVEPPLSMRFQEKGVATAGQVAAERAEDYRMLSRALAEFPLQVVRDADHLLATAGDQLYRSEKVLGVAGWLLALQERLDGERNRHVRESVAWRAAATAPPGFCHVRSSMIGTLLEDLGSGLGFPEVSRRFAEKMHPLQYQRPTAPPSAGNLLQAERAVEALGIAAALPRRFARLEDVEALWVPRPAAPAQPPGGGVFAHLHPKAARPAAPEAPPSTVTWDKFRRTVLPGAESIEYYVPAGLTSYIALVTAADPAAPPIVQWDREDRRNPVTWYVYHNGSRPADWNLTPRTWCKVSALTFLPPMWGREEDVREHQGAGVVVLLEGARDLRHRTGGGFFPEQLRAELHGVRRTLEAYALSAPIAGGDQATACGVDLRKGRPWEERCVLRVTTAAGRASYRLDRWD